MSSSSATRPQTSPPAVAPIPWQLLAALIAAVVLLVFPPPASQVLALLVTVHVFRTPSLASIVRLKVLCLLVLAVTILPWVLLAIRHLT